MTGEVLLPKRLAPATRANTTLDGIFESRMETERGIPRSSTWAFPLLERPRKRAPRVLLASQPHRRTVYGRNFNSRFVIFTRRLAPPATLEVTQSLKIPGSGGIDGTGPAGIRHPSAHRPGWPNDAAVGSATWASGKLRGVTLWLPLGMFYRFDGIGSA